MKILKTISIILISIFISNVSVKADKFQIVDLSKINNFERFFKTNKKYKIIIRNKNHLFSQNIIKTFKPKKIEFQNREYYIVDITDFNYHYTLLIHPDIKSKNIIYFYDFAEKISLRNSISFNEDNSLINVKLDKRSPFKKRYIDIKEYMKGYYPYKELKDFIYFDGEFLNLMQMVNSNLLIPIFYNKELKKNNDFKFSSITKENIGINDINQNFNHFYNLYQEYEEVCGLTNTKILMNNSKIYFQCNNSFAFDGKLLSDKNRKLINDRGTIIKDIVKSDLNLKVLNSFKIFTNNDLLIDNDQDKAIFTFTYENRVEKKTLNINSLINTNDLKKNGLKQIEIEFDFNMNNFPAKLYGLYFNLDRKEDILLNIIDDFEEDETQKNNNTSIIGVNEYSFKIFGKDVEKFYKKFNSSLKRLDFVNPNYYDVVAFEIKN